MDNGQKIRILLVEDNKDFAKLVQVYLQRADRERFEVVWRENYADTMKELASGGQFDVILMDYFLPGKNGLEITRELLEKKIAVPVVFLTVNKDFELAVDVMKLGVADYLVKEEIATPALPKAVIGVIEKYRLRDQLVQLELGQERLRAIHETLRGVMVDFEAPLGEMKALATDFKEHHTTDAIRNYVKIIDENVQRIIEKLNRLKSLKEYKTIKYIKNINMLDLS